MNHHFPEIKMTFVPYRHAIDNYATGLTNEIRERLENRLGCSLLPNSPFYSQWFNNSHKEIKVSPVIVEGRSIHLDKRNPFDEVAYYWLSVHPAVKKYHVNISILN